MHFRTAVFNIHLLKQVFTDEHKKRRDFFQMSINKKEIFTHKKGLKRFSLMITHEKKRFSQVIKNKKRFSQLKISACK